uniref:Vicilin-like antimicrobial peptides 2-1 isoform X2 n=1 Tax=Nicotiana tabacum TaxID=4097 RepID=A0A1S4DRE7_TOBAC|nr:PREDICTED: vicilin-like antimicrobial peptides 2-1 isoform X2 [Nicotiana tabacum]
MAIFAKPKLLFLFFLILSLFLASQCDDENPRGQDPRRELESCLRQCQVQSERQESPEQQLQCQRSCVLRYERQQREKSDEVIEDILTHHRDPESIYRECQQRCQRQEHGQQRQCQQRCEQEYRREQEQQHRGHQSGEDNQGREGRTQREPERRFRECQQRCQRQEQGQQQRQCQQRCEQEYRREQEQQHGGSEEILEENQGRGQREPERRFRECQQRCQRQEQGQQQRQCQQRCEQEYRREQEQQRGGSEEILEENQGRGQREPERRFRECQQRCQRQEQGQQQRQCQQSCEQEYRREQEQRRGGEESQEDNQGRDPQRRFRECQQRCQQQEQGRQQRRQCQQRCEEEFRREQEQQRRGQETGEERENPQREREEENNPYLFESQRFRSRFRATHGDFRVLEKFTERSELLRGIENYRVAVVEFEPLSFMLPHHCDAEAIFVVVRGRGTISIAEQDEKNSFNLEHGDVIRVNAGSTVYMLNRDNNERFFVYVLAQAVNTPGQFQEYFSAGGQNPESFYRAFSSDILETAFNTPRDRLERLFGQQKQGIIIKASEEQIRAISEHASRSTKQQTKGQTTGPFNLLKERPLFSSRFGQFFEASPDRFEQLRDLDAAVAFMNINQGGMVLPYYNTRSTRLAMVVEGNGRFEMACPHLGSQSQRQGSRGGRREQEREQEGGDVHYQKVRGTLSVGDVLVVPAGHPITFIATGGSNLRIVGFGVNAHNSRKNFLAGQQNIWRNVDREAKELSFNMPGKEVEEILQRQDQSYFVAGPEQHGQRQRERGEEGKGQQYLSSILDFVF